jgi:hypothetical protein
MPRDVRSQVPISPLGRLAFPATLRGSSLKSANCEARLRPHTPSQEIQP